MSDNLGSARAEDKKEQERGERRKAKQGGKKEQSEPSLNMSEVRELAELFDRHGFTDFEFENENIRVRLSKNAAPQIVQAYQSLPSPGSFPVQGNPSAQPSESATAAEIEVDSDAGLHKITSPIVGTFYRSPSPDKEPYVKEGSQVSADTTVCIVEAMKLMNEIQAEVAGEVVKIYVENGQPVEYGQPLFGIKK